MIWYENGKIMTDMSDMSFMEEVLQKWGKMSEDEACAIVESMEAQEMSDSWLTTEGVTLVQGENCVEDECIVLIKTGEHEWEIKDSDPEDNEWFIKKYF